MAPTGELSGEVRGARICGFGDDDGAINRLGSLIEHGTELREGARATDAVIDFVSDFVEMAREAMLPQVVNHCARIPMHGFRSVLESQIFPDNRNRLFR